MELQWEESSAFVPTSARHDHGVDDTFSFLCFKSKSKPKLLSTFPRFLPPFPGTALQNKFPNNNLFLMLLILSIPLLFLFLIFFYHHHHHHHHPAMATPSPSCDSSGPAKPSTPLLSFLQRLQSTALKALGPSDFDPKLYVDLPLRFDLSSTEKAFDALRRKSLDGTVSAEELEEFLKGNLGRAGSDLETAVPKDFAPVPEGFLVGVEREDVRAWAVEVHGLWRELCRRVVDDVRERRESHTLLPLPEFAVIPGSRFREVYYWDSFWVIRGLLASKMYDTAKGIVNNLLSLLDEYGFVLNGARTYYTNRSQPPLLSSMIMELFNKTGDMTLVKKAFPLLLKEHSFWNSGIHKVVIKDAEGSSHIVNRYYAMWNKPRPESATIDEESASKLTSDSAKEQFYREVASAAESGWDFSTRWMRDPSDLTTLAATSIIPVDLNTFMLKMELDIVFLARLIGDDSAAEKFSAASQARVAAMGAIFWSPKMDQWLDYWLTDNGTCEEVHTWEEKNQNQNIFASNFTPLWIELFSSDGELVKKVMKSLLNSGLLHNAGIATSLTNSGQQWDFPNGWAPLQHMIVEGLVRSGLTEAKVLAEDIAVKWIRTNYAGYKRTGHMFEKYDVQACGKTGGGGEYVPQTGFGWTNGVLLAFLEEFGWPRDREIDC